MCAVVGRMRPECADTVPMSISVTGQLSDRQLSLGESPASPPLQEGIGLGQGLSRLLYL